MAKNPRRPGNPRLKPEKPQVITKVRQETKTNTEVTFAGIIHNLAPKPTRPVNHITMQAAPVAHLPYNEELKLKDAALAQFWEKNQLPGSPKPVIPSPRPRGYRTTSKRRAFLRGPHLYLAFGDKLLKTQKKYSKYQ